MKLSKIILGSLLAVGATTYGVSTLAATQWKDVDPNCTRNDTVFTGLDGKKYVWAACNSTLGNPPRDYGAGGLTYGNGIYACRKTTKVSDPTLYYSYLTKETDITGGVCKMDNIMGKMYGWTYLQSNCKASTGNNFTGTGNANCACPDGRHVPSREEWQTAIDYYNSTVSPVDHYIGWGGLAPLSGFVRQLNLPLNGIGDTANFAARGERGYYWSSTLSGGNSSYAYGTLIMGEGRNNRNGVDYASWIWLDPVTNGGIRLEKGVRCVKDEGVEYEKKLKSKKGHNIKIHPKDAKTTVSK